MATAQDAIFVEGSAHHWFLEYDLARADLGALRGRLKAALEPPPDAPSGATQLVVGFGEQLWRELGTGSPPAELRQFRGVDGPDGRRAPATPHDLWIWIHGDRRDEGFARALHVHRTLSEAVSLALEERGFTFRDSRDLTGFVNGSANPKGEKRQEAALVPEGEPGAGGSVVLTQRWIHDLDAFYSLPESEQEAVIGRTKPDSIELTGDALPPDSHMSRADLAVNGVAQKIYRRSAPIGGVAEHGLYFLAFSRDPARFEAILRSMFGVSGDGIHDRLVEYSRPRTGAFYFAPSLEDLAAAIG